MPTMRHMRIFMSFHHICLRTRLAPLRKPWADWARLSVLSCRESRFRRCCRFPGDKLVRDVAHANQGQGKSTPAGGRPSKEES
jgi:hypothetical protein